MKIDPKKIARMISEDPDVAPDDHFDDTEDEYIDPNACRYCGKDATDSVWHLPYHDGHMMRCDECDICACDGCISNLKGAEEWNIDADYDGESWTQDVSCPDCSRR